MHIDASAAMTGISRFLEEPTWQYSKDENLTDFSSSTHLVSGISSVPGFTRIHSQLGFVRFRFSSLEVLTEPLIYVHARDDLVRNSSG